VTLPYQHRATEHTVHRDIEVRRSITISRARLAVFLVATAVLIWILAGHPGIALVAADLALFVVFGVLVVWHARVEDRVAWHDALRTVALRGAARLGRNWEDLPPGEAPSSIDLTHHPYAMDLDLFGRASLFQWLGPAATARGSFRLATWLLHPAEADVARARQNAVTELSVLDEWREQLSALGELARDARQEEIDTFLAWAEAAQKRLDVYVVAVALTVSIWILFALFLLDIVDAALWLMPLMAGIVLSFTRAKWMYTAFDRAGAGQRALARYAQLFEHATAARFSTPVLQMLQDRLSIDGTRAPRCMQRLNRILGFAELRTGAAILHFPIQAFTLWDFHVFFALERWRRAAGSHVRDWLEALAEIDCLSAMATAKRDNASWVMPDLDDQPIVRAETLGHPLIPDDRRVANDVTVGPPRTLLLVTGSNMSGKSTLLRAIGLNIVLAQAGCCVCASRLRLPPCDLQTSIRVQDSLELGLSYFMAALARLKAVVDAAEQERGNRVLLYLLDEILQGTNSAERSIAVRAVTRHLLDAGAIGVMTTHDLNVASLEPLKSSAALVHFTETVDDRGTMAFDYRLRDGLATSRNALRLMQMIGISVKAE
jgi:ABC-type multidrug transport system fused ATPase/permease subunit